MAKKKAEQLKQGRVGIGEVFPQMVEVRRGKVARVRSGWQRVEWLDGLPPAEEGDYSTAYPRSEEKYIASFG